MAKKSSIFKNYLLSRNKLDYVRKKKDQNIECILCSIIINSEKVQSLKIFQDEIGSVCLNLYPYNPGHLMVFPIRHITDFKDLTDNEILHLSHLIRSSQGIISEIYQPTGFNIGTNIGENSGASIEHLHFHIVPRFKDELGYIDIIGKTRVIVEPVSKVFDKFKTIAHKHFNIKNID